MMAAGMRLFQTWHFLIFDLVAHVSLQNVAAGSCQHLKEWKLSATRGLRLLAPPPIWDVFSHSAHFKMKSVY